MAIIRIILVLVVQSCLGYRNCPAAVVDRESSHVSRELEFYVFYDLYDALSSSSSMVETAASSASDKIVSRGGFESSIEEKTAAKAFNVSAKGLNVSQRAFSHSELVFCEKSQLESVRGALHMHIGKKLPNEVMENKQIKSVQCFNMYFRRNKKCTEKACGIYQKRRKFFHANALYSQRERIHLGLATIESHNGNPLETLVETIKTKKDQWKGTDHKLATHNSNTFATYVVNCVLDLKMPSKATLGASHAVSSASSTKWVTSIGATVLGALAAGPLGLFVFPAVFAAMPAKFCD